MQTLIWNPWSIFDELHDTVIGSSEWPLFDVEDCDDETILTADVPGMREADIDVIVQGPLLIVRGQRRVGNEAARFVRRRRFDGSFERRFHLGDAYDTDHVEANLADGVLRVRLPKAARARPRRIKLTTGVVDKVKALLAGKRDDEAENATRAA